MNQENKKLTQENAALKKSLQQKDKKINSLTYFSKKEYATIIDESMMLGSEKMLITLGVDAEKTNNNALQYSDIKVLNISVDEKWNSEKIKENLVETEKKVGHCPLYSISDNDTKLRKALRENGRKWIRDIGHTIALLIEKVYGEDVNFKEFTKYLSSVKIREVMRPSSYLLPPRQRTIARFMNLSPIIQWAIKIYKNFSKLSKEEAKNFKFVKKHFSLIEELEQVFNCVNDILKQAKNEGYSKKKIKDYIRKIKKSLTLQSSRVQQVKIELCTYLEEEMQKLPTSKSLWHCSSDIIESMFGMYKFKQSRNKLNGITPYVLVIPLVAAAGHKSKPSKIDFKRNLDGVFMKDLNQWKIDNLTENLVVKRRKKLAA